MFITNRFILHGVVITFICTHINCIHIEYLPTINMNEFAGNRRDSFEWIKRIYRLRFYFKVNLAQTKRNFISIKHYKFKIKKIK